jgi:hypothetical protein
MWGACCVAPRWPHASMYPKASTIRHRSGKSRSRPAYARLTNDFIRTVALREVTTERLRPGPSLAALMSGHPIPGFPLVRKPSAVAWEMSLSAIFEAF